MADEKTIKLTPEAVQAVNELCDAENLDIRIMHLKDTEEALQKIAYQETDCSLDYLYRFAYELKLIREEFEKLEKILGYEPGRER